MTLLISTSTYTYNPVRKLIQWATLSALTVSLLCGCQQDMAYQPHYSAMEPNAMFKDGSANRPLIPQAVARGNLKADEALYTGKLNGELVTSFPMTITEEVIRRGQNRYQIYCSPCHSQLGDGNGMIVQRGVTRPPSFHDERLTTAPVGHIYDVITNGFGQMYSYNHVPVTDRWAIVSYVRTLQISNKGTIEDVPAERRVEMEAMTTGTLPAVAETKTDAHGGAH